MKRLLRVAGIIAGALAGYVYLLRPWFLRWGATENEVDGELPGDNLIPEPRWWYTRSITIHAPASVVWPWLVQMGQGRGGFYSYDVLENLFGLDIHSAYRIIPELQHLRVGDVIALAPGEGPKFKVAHLEMNRSLVLRSMVADVWDTEEESRHEIGLDWRATWVFFLDPSEDGERTRLVVRSRFQADPTRANQVFYYGLLEPVNFIMERKMLKGIKVRAEVMAQVVARRAARKAKQE